ncbi:site-specific integrase [Parafrankia sp. BMG5.11]|uniref:tyrosine-type recombinase/integrase n=1 Tax=Parafrankia sp. BMG5.11 TaxID=222540 RepID=UPI001038792E|nr:site-specific integrase [Parafrankia sp. BMG5.11]TCJ41398.1 site-specific integrase [Parafrankia sp. BMG5.11]
MTQPAKVLAAGDVRRLYAAARRGRHGTRNFLIVSLSYRAGLRAQEVAGLQWGMVLQANGRVGTLLNVAGTIAKNGRGRHIPTHPDLRAALDAVHREQGRPRQGPVIRSQRGTHMTPRSVVNWFAALYAKLGMDGCSSHSGRRTFITSAAKMVSKAGGSLRDVQELAGHRALTTTERYIEGDRDAQRKLVRMM